ncbi:MAG: hypothetical protein EP305_09920 [Bacteroidetes bacterium]|nr:MAG: hypothetical protein EP305_09920 [Bacteroidota bacterium]
MRLFFILIIGLSFMGCKKGKGEFTLKGNISDNTFNTSHAGAVVKLYQVPVGTTDLQLIGTQTLGSDGNYSFTFPREKMERYVLKASKDLYFDVNENIYFSTMTLEEDNVRNFGTTAKSWVNLRFINVSPSSASDFLAYTKQSGKADCEECCSKDQQNLYGIVDTSIICVNDGNTMYSYFYYLSGTSNNGIKSVITTAFDTTELLLQY